jgi:hypothetical protein
LLIFLGYARESNNKTCLTFWTINSTLSPQSDHINPAIFVHKLQLCLINYFSHYSYRKREIEHLITLTDSFTWEELPTRDPDTGYVTDAGYIPIIQTQTKNIVSFALAFHFIQSAVRIVMNHETIFPVWFPIDVSWSPLYEIINFMQVMFTLLR